MRAVQTLLWEEHCIECAPPDCYSVCPLFVERGDDRCARFYYGIFPNPDVSGLFGFGADLRFRRWGKLEARLPAGSATPERMRGLAALDRTTLRAVEPIVATLESIDPGRRLRGERKVKAAYSMARERILAEAGHDPSSPMDDLVVEVINPSAESFDLIIEVDAGYPLARRSLTLAPGQNFHTIPARELLGPFPGGEQPRRIMVYPEHDLEVRLIFTWLDFVTYRTAPVRQDRARDDDGMSSSESAAPASKVKCVAWDLDDTLWKGVLIEDGPDALIIREGVADAIVELDRRGILNAVVSKNDMDEAWRHVESTGLAEYFVAREINWQPKSANLRSIAERLDIGIDTIALIDDSAFERGEVESQLPQVRTYSEGDLHQLLERPEFDVMITDESRQRRHSYLAESQRRAYANETGMSYKKFLEACELQIEVFEPTEPHARSRSLELIQRTNQLNLSTHRYTEEEFDALLSDPELTSIAWRCRDRFGDYGIVGFMTVGLDGDGPIIRDLVISCRVARKKVENGLVRWLAGALHERGFATLRAAYRPTARNHVLLDALRDAGFEVLADSGETHILSLPVDQEVPDGWIAKVDAMELPPSMNPGVRPEMVGAIRVG